MTLLVLIDHDRGEMPEAAREALTAGRALAGQLDTSMTALLAGSSGAGLADECGAFGADAVLVAEHDLLADYGPEAWAQTVIDAVAAADAGAVLAGGSDRGNEVLAHVAARLDAPFVANCVSFEPGSPWAMSRVQWGGSLLEDVTLDAALPLVTVALHSTPSAPAPSPGDAAVSTFDPELGPELARTVVVERDVQSSGVTLATAPVVVSGGRGVGSADGFAALDELADLLGGRVGCSRAVTNNGWRPHSDQVGQTGTRIAPELYIAAGISGAIQHWVGAKGAKRILAINTDPEANMVTKADYAVIADLHEVIPAITEEVRRRRDA